MAVLATDTFTRADGASLGANWTVAKGVTEELGILTNQAKQTTAGATAGNYYSAVTAPNDQYSQAVLVALTNYWLGVTVRSITSGTSRNVYAAGQDVGDFGGLNTTSRVWKEVAGVVTSLGTGATALAAGQTWYLEAQGTALKMKINGTQEISVTDSAFASGQFGIQSFNTGSGGIAVFDTWEGGDFSASGQIIRNARIPNRFVGPAAQRYHFRRTTPLDTTVANAATTVSDAFSSAAAATATFTTQSSAAVPFSSAGVATATFATASSASVPFSSAGVATATFNAQSSAAVAFASAGAATATFTTQSGAQSPLAAAGVATATFTTQSSVVTPFAIAGVATATFNTQASASADFTMSGTATAIFTATTGGSSAAEAFMAGSATANFAAASLAPSAFTVSGQATVLFRGRAVTANQRPYLKWGKRPPAHETYDEEILALSHAMGSYLIDMVEGRYVSKSKIKLGKKAH